MARLIALSGLPGVGKTTLARALAERINAVHLRVDSVEAAMKRSVLKIHPAEDAGYLVLAAVAKDNLLLGFDVIVDTVNPVALTRNLWAATASEGHARLSNVEVVCKDTTLHRARVETRTSDIAGLEVPTWDAVSNRTYDPWQEDRVVVDTGENAVAECVSVIVQALA